MIRRIGRTSMIAVVALALGVGGLAPATAGAATAVPFRGWDVGGFVLPGACAGGVAVDIDGAGTATHVGRYEYSALECFNPDAGTVAGTADPNVITYAEDFVIDGGTGRFAGASGHLTVDGLADLATGAYSQMLSGSLADH